MERLVIIGETRQRAWLTAFLSFVRSLNEDEFKEQINRLIIGDWVFSSPASFYFHLINLSIFSAIRK